jgi:photosystem II stability/assembly factor-like uncharacterized protein
MRSPRLLVALVVLALVGFALRAGFAQPVDPSLLTNLKWRTIGPFRGGRAVAVSGVPGDARTYYFGAVGGGVWKTENAGTTWKPIMDSQPVSSIGAIAVAPSDPSTVYAGSGEADMRSDIIGGNGMYVSRDAGETWAHIGLDDSRQIGRILVDPRDPKTLLVAALGHAYGPNDMRGVYRSGDAGATWTRVLFLDRDSGAIDLAADPAMHVVFASLWQTRRPPWSVYPPSNGPGTGLYVSGDGGVTWRPVRGGGFPADGLGKIGLAVAPSNPQRVYAIVDAKAGGLYRSDDGGATWRLMDGDRRLWKRGWYFCHVAVDPKDPDLVYVSDTSFYRSTNGGMSFSAIKGSPDGDDFHQLWIDPGDGTRMVLGSDQGASVSLDAARTWSSWFNQPTGQIYRLATDDAFPYHIYGSQQDSGALMILSRSDHSGIEERDWRPITAGDENGALAPDPGDENTVFGSFVQREDLHDNQTRSVSPTTGVPGLWRAEWTMPLVFGTDRALYAARQSIFRSRDGGERWTRISGDLTRRHAGVPATLDAATAADAGGPEPRGVVYAIAPSPLRADTVWAGTDDGLVYVTRDGARTWHDVTPPALGAWSHVDQIEASHFDPGVAYLAVDRHRLDDNRPYIYLTRDGARSWQAANAGIPDGSFVYVVREDPARRGLLYAGTETGVFVSLDDGASWQSLQRNMPSVSVHDLAVHDGDLIAATHGRAFWVLDDVTPLRQLAADRAAGARLFAPRRAVRTRAPSDEAEASPPETPLGENPPNGAFIDYLLPRDVMEPVTLSIADARGAIVRRWSSSDVPPVVDTNAVDFPAYLIVPPQVLPASPGVHRFVWDFHALRSDGPLAPPGTYAVRLGVNGRTLSEPLSLVRDPRVHASDGDLVAQWTLASAVDVLQGRLRAATAAAEAVHRKPNAELHEEARLLAELEAAVESADTAPSPYEVETWQSLQAQTMRSMAAAADAPAR